MDPEWLFHYTTQIGLVGILRSRTLRATKIQYLNDASEFTLALNLARTQIESMQRSGSFTADAELLEAMKGDLERVESVNVHVCSLTEEADQLSQWRGYARPGDAFSIGFRTDHLKEAALRVGWELVKCTYLEREQEQAIRGLLTSFLPDASKSDIAATSWRAIQALVRLAPTIKHSGFAEEQEWRLVSPPIDARNPEYDFRPGKHTLIPFIPFHLADAGAKVRDCQLFIGPATHPRLSAGAAGTLLALNAESYSVFESKVPFRDW